MQPPDGPPICTALYALPSGIPPPMSKTTWRIVVPMATSTRPVWVTLPERAKTLVPLLVSVPTAAKASGPIVMRCGMLASVSTLLMMVGLPNSPWTAGKGGPRTRHAAPALDAVDQRGLLAADERAGAHLDDDVQVEAADQRCSGPSRPAVVGLFDCLLAAVGWPADTRPECRRTPSTPRSRRRRWPCLPAAGADRPRSPPGP